MSGIYIHIPFCKQACYYCDFHFSTSLKKKDELLQALKKELVLRREELTDPIETIYLGGGTPSLLSVNEITSLLQIVYDNYTVIKYPEITLEANPDDLTQHKIKALSKTDINRLSIGIQSFFDDDLQFMNRAHDATEALHSIKTATRYFSNITIDLIYGIPNLSAEKWQQNLQLAFDLGINHISSYALTVEPKTALDTFIKKGKIEPLDEALALEHFKILTSEVKKQGFIHYETSNFAKQGFFSKHNTSYWLGKHYLGIGPSAHSFNGQSRRWNISNNIKYINALSKNTIPEEVEILSANDVLNEKIMIGLRTIWGISLHDIETEFGKAIKNKLIQKTAQYIDNKTLVIQNNSIRATEKGQFLIDGISSDLFWI